MKQVRSINRANKAMIAEAVAAIEGLALRIFRGPAIFWYWRPSQQAIRPEALVECYRRSVRRTGRGNDHLI
jgi:histidinol-phosphate aminotransferase